MVEAMSSLASCAAVQPIDSLPATVTEAWLYGEGALGTSLQVILGSKKGSVEFTRQILKSLESGHSEKFALMSLHFLFLLISEEHLSEETSKLLRGIEIAGLDPESRLMPLVQELREVAA
jgi:hypothetical protein